jgi:hypothetical protein
MAYNAGRTPLSVRFSTGVVLKVEPFELRTLRTERP